MYTLDEDEVAIRLVISNIFAGFLGRLQPLITTPDDPISPMFSFFVQTFLGDFNLQKLPFGRPRGLWE